MTTDRRPLTPAEIEAVREVRITTEPPDAGQLASGIIGSLLDTIAAIRAECANEVDKVREVWDAEIEAERKRCAGITDKAAITQIATWIACLTASSKNMLDLAARIRKGENQQ